MKLLNLRGGVPVKFALALMDAIFDDELMANSCYPGIKSKKQFPPLPGDKIKLIEGTNCK